MSVQNETVTLQSASQTAEQKLELASSAHAEELKTLRENFARQMEAKEKKFQDELANQQTARYDNLKANLEDADISHLIKSLEKTMVAIEDADNYEGGQAPKDTATLEHTSNIPPRKDDDGTDEGGPSHPTQASKTLPKSTRT
ncbi:hypothetical protein R1flu_010249 [Riccia fluitans]|uniref:Uncharacterized protein n=1 Tax=Riccia fluitans TaxID=41844 RepID=A0ABD1Z8N6_9MARC